MTEFHSLDDAFTKVKEIVKAAKIHFEEWIKDPSYPLDERWEAFLEAPDYLKNTTLWIYHFKAFSDFNNEYGLNELERSVLYEYENRGTHIKMSDWDELLFGMVNADQSNDSDFEPWCNSEGRLFASAHYDAWREEVLAKNIGFVTFDW